MNHPRSAPTLYRRATRSRSTRTEPETKTIPENGNGEDRPPPDIVFRRGGSSSINGEGSSAMSSLSPSRSAPASNLRRSNKRALKEATTLVKRGEMGTRKAVRLMNERYQSTRKSERLLTKSTVSDYVAKGLIGSSPQKRGPLPKLPKDFNMLLNAHVEMKQLEQHQESEGEVGSTGHRA